MTLSYSQEWRGKHKSRRPQCSQGHKHKSDHDVDEDDDDVNDVDDADDVAKGTNTSLIKI